MNDADLEEASEDEICNACQRQSLDCSRNPCPQVIHDRGDKQTDYAKCGACDRALSVCISDPCDCRKAFHAEIFAEDPNNEARGERRRGMTLEQIKDELRKALYALEKVKGSADDETFDELISEAQSATMRSFLKIESEERFRKSIGRRP